MKWISVEDRLPIASPDVFNVYYSVEVIVFDGTSVEPCLFEAGKVPEFWRSFSLANVTHWMPLPDKPE